MALSIANEVLNLKKYKRIAIMGGTFDPIHYGHLVTAEAVRNEFNVELVLFIPTGSQPYKESSSASHREHRYLMTVIATAANEYFAVSRIEIDREGSTYTIDTINELTSLCKKNTEIFFITGADAVLQILSWKGAKELLTKCSFIAVTRPGYNRESLFEHALELKNKYAGKLHFLEVPALAISSTDIRSRVRTDKPIKYLLPDEVEKYIIKQGLYKSGIFSVDIQDVKKQVRKRLSEKRYIHTLGVVGEAVKLAEFYGADVEKAYLAALLHDIAKELPNKTKLSKSKAAGIKIDNIMNEQPDLLHSFLGAELAKSDFKINDSEILDAIRFHTFGKAGMTLLEKIIYLADVIEPNREIYEGLGKIRSLAFDDINKAVYTAMDTTISYVKSKNRSVYYLGQEALSYYEDLSK